jgi:transposase
MYVDIATSKQNGRIYSRALLRECYRENGKVKHNTIANISSCTKEEITAIKLALKHKGDLSNIGSFKEKIKSKQGLIVGAIILLKSLCDRLKITQTLGNSTNGKLALWQIMARIIEHGSRLSAVRLAGSHAVCDILNLDSFTEDDLYLNLDWLCDNQQDLEQKLFKARYDVTKIPRLFLYDVTSSYIEGMENELSNWGYNRDKKKGKKQIVIGLLTDEDGVPVSVDVFEGNTTDTLTFGEQIRKLADRFSIKEATVVGDRGMIKSAQIEELTSEGFSYITAITKPQIETLIKNNVIQLELFNEKLCEVESDGIRYILRRNPIRVNELETIRNEKIDKLEQLIETQNEYLSQHEKANLEVAIKKIKEKITKYKFSDFIKVESENRKLLLVIDEKKKAEKVILDGCYVIKTDLGSADISKESAHDRYKDLAMVEQGFSTMKTGLLETRPIYVRKEKRTRGHVFVVMLAYMVIHELKKLWKDVDVTVEEGITELSTICSIEIDIESATYQQIPKPRKLGASLLNLANVKLPEAIPSRNINATTRKKLTERRKK